MDYNLFGEIQIRLLRTIRMGNEENPDRAAIDRIIEETRPLIQKWDDEVDAYLAKEKRRSINRNNRIKPHKQYKKS